MQMQKGICLELNNDRSVFILNDGRFVEGRPADAAAVGEEVYFFPKLEKAKRHAGFFWVPAILAAAILLLVFAVAVPSKEAYAYVQIEVNPSIELGIDEEFRVVSLRELNEDGVEVVSKLKDWENLPLDEVLEKAIVLSLQESTEEMTITTVVTGSNKEDSAHLEDAVMAVSAKVAKEKLEVHLKKANLEQWRKSIKENVPVGQKVKDFKVFEVPLQSKEKSGNKPAPKEGKQEEQKDHKKAPVKTTPAVPKQNKQNVPPAKEKKAPASDQKNKETPPGQEKKAAPPEKEKNIPSPGQEKKLEPPKQEKKKAIPPGREKKSTPPGQEKKKSTPPGQEKKAAPPAKGNNVPNSGTEKKPPGQEKKNKDPDHKKNNHSNPGQEKKKENGHVGNPKKGKNGKE